MTPLAILRLLMLCCLWLAGSASAAPSAQPLLLDGQAETVDAWPALTVLSDPDRRATLHEVIARSDEFRPPAGPRGNFGTRRDAVWLHLPLRNASDASEWVLQFDYPMLQRIDVVVLRDGREVQRGAMGSSLPFAQRTLPALSHAMTLELPPHTDAELYIRVQTETAMMLPITLSRPAGFLRQAGHATMLQGLYLGLALALLSYAVFNAVSLRDRMFAHYAVMLAGVVGFFSVYFGVAQQYLLPHGSPLVPQLAPLSILLMMSAACLFIANALDLPPRSWVRRALQAVSLFALAVLGATLAGWIDYLLAQRISSMMGPVPLLLALPSALAMARRGDRGARWLVLGWGGYLLGAICITGLLRGLLPFNVVTQHAFLLSTMVEMLAWVRVLGLRIEAVRRNAERVDNERRAMKAMAHTDPLTGLPNRRGLQEALQTALGVARADQPLAVYLIDLDGFKPVNDRLGHDAGDELLVKVGRRLCEQLRDGDVVGRLGGDEFVVLTPGLDGEARAMAIGLKLVEAFAVPFVVGGNECRVGLTVGFALAPHDGQSPADLLKRADAAMYLGKQQGRNCVRRGGASDALAGWDPPAGEALSAAR